MNAVTGLVEATEIDYRIGKFSTQERERLILDHLPQVQLVARRIHRRLPSNVSLDDLVSIGVIGLISAIDHFDLSRGVRLKTYAEHKIKGAILDSLRHLDWAPRLDRKHAKQIECASATVEQRLQRAPTEDEIARELNLPVDRYRQWQVTIRGLNLARLESAGGRDSEDRDLRRLLSAGQQEWPAAELERSELKRVLAMAIAGIPDMEQTVLSLHYRDGLTLREISKIVALHESRISQLKSQAILRLRMCMSQLWPATGQAVTVRTREAIPETVSRHSGRA